MINQKVLLKNETTYRFGGMCKNFFLLDDKKDLDNFDEYDNFSRTYTINISNETEPTVILKIIFFIEFWHNF